MKHTIAIYRSKYGYDLLAIVDDNGSSWADRDGDYIRISQNKEVEFEPFNDGEKVHARMIELKAKEEQLYSEYQAAVNRISDERQKLLSQSAEAGEA